MTRVDNEAKVRPARFCSWNWSSFKGTWKGKPISK